MRTICNLLSNHTNLKDGIKGQTIVSKLYLNHYCNEKHEQQANRSPTGLQEGADQNMATTSASAVEIESTPSDISQFIHTPYYCEENVYFLCKNLCTNNMADPDGADLFVVFISNRKKQIPLWHQKASKRADGLVLWDYHVICVQRKREGDFPFLVWDLDSNLPLPTPLGSYVSKAVRPSFQLFPEYQRYFRIVHAPIFLLYFASDRRHMKDSDGNWTVEPPDYVAIIAEDGAVHNLNEYTEIMVADVLTNNNIDVKEAVFSLKLGAVTNDLEEFFTQVS